MFVGRTIEQTFVGTQTCLKKIMQSWDIPNFQGVLCEEFSCDFKWQWNIPHASHQNGVVETLIKSVSQSLNATCKNQAFTKEQWKTFLSETTYIINGRALYPSSNDIWDPSHRTIFLFINTFRHLNQNQRKRSTPDIFLKEHELMNSGNAG